MKIRHAVVAALLLGWACILPAQDKSTAERLGYPADAKLLIIHADDLALAHSVNEASFEALDKGHATSASIMVPCPWFSEVVDQARRRRDADLGIHLTLNSEWKYFRWGPVGPGEALRGLVDPMGYLWPDLPSVGKFAKPEEVERELRAQVDRVLKAGLLPTHLDGHMGTVFMPAFFPVYVKIAREYGIPFFMIAPRNIPPSFSTLVKAPSEFLKHITPTDIFPDVMVSAHPGVPAEKWLQFYIDTIRNLKPGLTELIVHLGYDDAELQAVTMERSAFGSAWRQRDFDVLANPEFKKALADNHVTLIGWKEIGKRTRTGPVR